MHVGQLLGNYVGDGVKLTELILLHANSHCKIETPSTVAEHWRAVTVALAGVPMAEVDAMVAVKIDAIVKIREPIFMTDLLGVSECNFQTNYQISR